MWQEYAVSQQFEWRYSKTNVVYIVFIVSD